MLQHETVLDRNASGVLDICRVKHGGHPASVAAHERALHGKARMYAILTALFEAHPEGLTSKEIAELLGEENRNRFAPRLSEMKASELLCETGQRKQGCSVLRYCGPKPEFLSEDNDYEVL